MPLKIKKHKYLYIHLILFLVVLGFYLLFPKFDLYVSGLFYKPEAGFYLADHPLLIVIYKGTRYVAAIFAVALLIVCGLSYWRRWRKYSRASLFCLCALIISAGVVVDFALKGHWDRARPRDVVEFGGHAQFTPPYLIANQCEKNCSFVSGHAAAGFSLLVFVYVLPQLLWRFWLISSMSGFTIGAVRVMQGGHFLSDIVFCYFIMFAVLHIIFILFGGHKQALLPAAPQ